MAFLGKRILRFLFFLFLFFFLVLSSPIWVR
jgi:hypothetical protein